VNIDFAEIIKALKELGKAQFFIILTLLVIGFFVYLFQEPIMKMLEKSFAEEQRIEFREVRDLHGLEVELDSIKTKYALDGYAVYIYQPKDFAYYKKILLTDYDLIKSVTSLQGVYLDEQLYINDQLSEQDYVLIDEEDINNDTEFFRAVGFKSLMIKRLMFNGKIIGEVYIIFAEKPKLETVQEIAKLLAPLNYKYVI